MKSNILSEIHMQEITFTTEIQNFSKRCFVVKVNKTEASLAAHLRSHLVYCSMVVDGYTAIPNQLSQKGHNKDASDVCQKHDHLTIKRMLRQKCFIHVNFYNYN